MDKIKVILVDDHNLVRDGIKSLITGEEDIEIIGEAGSFDELELIMKRGLPDILILDIALGDTSGIEIAEMYKDKYPGISIMMLSMYMSDDFIFNSLRAGAKGYLPKNTSKKELLAAIRTIFSGSVFFSNEVSDIILKSYVNNANPDSPREGSEEMLTKREKEVLTFFAEGKTNQEIADQLYISIRTVESHKNHIMQKLNLRTPVDLVKFAIKNKFIEL